MHQQFGRFVFVTCLIKRSQLMYQLAPVLPGIRCVFYINPSQHLIFSWNPSPSRYERSHQLCSFIARQGSLPCYFTPLANLCCYSPEATLYNVFTTTVWHHDFIDINKINIVFILMKKWNCYYRSQLTLHGKVDGRPPILSCWQEGSPTLFLDIFEYSRTLITLHHHDKLQIAFTAQW